MIEPPYTADLYDALEDLIGKVREHVPDLPTSVESSLQLGEYVLARVKIERKRRDINI